MQRWNLDLDLDLDLEVLDGQTSTSTSIKQNLIEVEVGEGPSIPEAKSKKPCRSESYCNRCFEVFTVNYSRTIKNGIQ